MSRRGFLVAAMIAFTPLFGAAPAADDQLIRWDIIVLTPGPAVNAGGVASAKATNVNQTAETSTLTITGSGTFKPPKQGQAENAVTGGGTFSITTGGSTVAGTYEVIGVVQWNEAPGVLGPADNIGNPADARAGLAVLLIAYSDGDFGTLVVSCSLTDTPNTVFEGITATKGFTGYWKAQPPTGTPATANANRTLFHVINEEEEDD